MAEWKRSKEPCEGGGHGDPIFQLILAHFVYGYIIKAAFGTTDPSVHIVVNLCRTRGLVLKMQQIKHAAVLKLILFP